VDTRLLIVRQHPEDGNIADIRWELSVFPEVRTVAWAAPSLLAGRLHRHTGRLRVASGTPRRRLRDGHRGGQGQ